MHADGVQESKSLSTNQPSLSSALESARPFKFEIVGAGGIGCAVGYALKRAGASVTFVDADLEKVTWGRTHGVCVDGLEPLAADFRSYAEWTPEPESAIVLCTKCYDNAVVLARTPSSAMLIPIQNGFDRALETRFKGPEGIASFVSECLPHKTHTRITRKGKLHLGYRGATINSGNDRGLLQQLLALLNLSPLFRLAPVPDILPYKYTKLMYNAAISPVAAAAGIDNGQLLALPNARKLFFGLLAENYGILKNAGITLGKIGPFHPDTVAKILRRTMVARSMAWVFYPTLRKTYCSMSGDLPRGRTEIDYYNHHLIEVAGDYPCPLNQRIYALVKRIESERIQPSTDLLTEVVETESRSNRETVRV